MIPNYVVLEVVLDERFVGKGSKNLPELEVINNEQCAKGYRLHTITSANGGSKGLSLGGRLMVTLVFESI